MPPWFGDLGKLTFNYPCREGEQPPPHMKTLWCGEKNRGISAASQALPPETERLTTFLWCGMSNTASPLVQLY